MSDEDGAPFYEGLVDTPTTTLGRAKVAYRAHDAQYEFDLEIRKPRAGPAIRIYRPNNSSLAPIPRRLNTPWPPKERRMGLGVTRSNTPPVSSMLLRATRDSSQPQPTFSDGESGIRWRPAGWN